MDNQAIKSLACKHSVSAYLPQGLIDSKQAMCSFLADCCFGAHVYRDEWSKSKVISCHQGPLGRAAVAGHAGLLLNDACPYAVVHSFAERAPMA